MYQLPYIKSFFSLLACVFLSYAQAQSVYSTSSAAPNFTFNKILNYTKPAASFDELKKELTIIDFFGTWCVPCIRALLHLSEVQERYKDDVSIILVSIEEEEKLKRFLVSRKNFSFPLAVDSDNAITNLFNPPSYPFTVILDRAGKVLATLTDAKDLTDDAVQGWLKGSVENKKVVSTNTIQPQNPVPSLQKSSNAAVQLSQDFIYAAKTGESVEKLQASLAALDYSLLQNMLNTDAEKKAFWINIYNGYTNALLKNSPELYSNRNKFFGTRQIQVAGMYLSLDEIEHDFLRRTKIKWSLGHLNKIFPSKRAKELRVKDMDYRIHFALNCGAKSCPPIAYYSPEQLETQLEMSTKNYLNSEVEFKKEENKIYLPAILSWFRADFGGKKGMKTILRKQGLLSIAENPEIKFKKYDWTLQLNNYKTE